MKKTAATVSNAPKTTEPFSSIKKAVQDTLLEDSNAPKTAEPVSSIKKAVKDTLLEDRDVPTTAERVSSDNAMPAGRRFSAGEDEKVPVIVRVGNIASDFLSKLSYVRQVRVTRVAQADATVGTWEAEAEVFVPNSNIAALGLEMEREVLDSKDYFVRLDSQLNIIAYGVQGETEGI